MAKDPIKVVGSELRELNGVQVIVFRGKDSIGRAVEMAIPAAGWDAVYEDGKARIEAAANASNGPIAGQWARSFHRPGVPAQVGTIDDGKVLVIARAGLPTETRLSFDRSDALALADEIRSTAERLPAGGKRTH